MVRSLAVTGLVLAALRGPGCGEVDSSESSANAPCTRDKDCASGLVCAEGVCQPPSSGSDAATDSATDSSAPSDASSDADSEADAGDAALNDAS